MKDDESIADKHMAAMDDLVKNAKVDFLANVQPAFAVDESIAANSLGVINIHGATTNDDVFARGEHVGCLLCHL